MDINKFLGPDFDDLNRFDEFYDELVRRLGGPAAIRRMIPFSDTVLRESYAKDPYFNDGLTPIRRWDAAADDKLPRFLASHGITATSLSQRVCVLKKAAERFCDPTGTKAPKPADEPAPEPGNSDGYEGFCEGGRFYSTGPNHPSPRGGRPGC